VIEVEKKNVSIIIPMYNEKSRIKRTVQRMNDFLNLHPKDEVIFVDDGSKDGTVTEVFRYRQHPKEMRVVCLLPNQGKWAAIRAGHFAARKKYVAILDADLSVGPDFIEDNRWMLNAETLIIGNRYGTRKAKVPWRRYILSRIFNFLVRTLIGIKHQDSQSPFKMWIKNKKFDDIFTELQELRFAGDVELIFRAREFLSTDIESNFEEESTLNVSKHAPEMFKALLRIRKLDV